MRCCGAHVAQVGAQLWIQNVGDEMKVKWMGCGCEGLGMLWDLGRMATGWFPQALTPISWLSTWLFSGHALA